MGLPDSSAPRRAAVGITVANIIITTAGALALAWLFPEMTAWTARLIVVLTLVGAVTALIAAGNLWRPAGIATHPRRWHLLALPALIAVSPLVGGVDLPGAGLLAVLIIGYAATGYFEEALFRGVLISVLRPIGVWPAVLISSALFACSHLPNMLFGQSPATTLAQAVGAFCFGVGYAALRLRTAGLWPLMVLHFLTDLSLQVGALPPTGHWTIMVAGDAVLLVYGIGLIQRRADGADLDRLAAHAPQFSTRFAPTWAVWK